MNINHLAAAIFLVTTTILCLTSNSLAGDLFNNMMRYQQDQDRQLKESTEYFNQSMDHLSATMDKKIFEAAKDDLFELIKYKGANNVTTNEVIEISQRRRLDINKTRQLFEFLRLARDMESTTQQYQGDVSNESTE